MKRCAWRAFGYSLGYRSPSWDLEALLTDVVLPDWHPVDPESADTWIEVRDLEVYDDDTHWTTARDREQLAHRLQQLTQMKLTWGSPETVFLHSAVVRVGESAWCIPGDSKAGKSTLVKALCARGALFYSDEFAAIDSNGLVRPYPRPLWTRTTRKQREKTIPEELGWRAGLGPIPISKLLLCSYRRDAEWRPVILTAAQAAQETAPLLKVNPKRKNQALAQLEQAFASASCLKGDRPDLEHFLPAIWE